VHHIALRLDFLSSTFTSNKNCGLSGMTQRVSAYGLLKESWIDGCEKMSFSASVGFGCASQGFRVIRTCSLSPSVVYQDKLWTRCAF